MPTQRPGSASEILTPTTLNQLVRDLLEDALPRIWIEGELSNVARPASGHLYFTLKDAGAQIRGAMFKPKSTWLKFRPEAGMHVLLRARVSLYAPRGDYQLIVEHMEEAGEGALRRAFEELKAKLQAEGLFAEARKRALPRFPRRIGVITSASGAAIHDVLSVLERRFPLASVDVLPVPVQGREAPPAITAMLRKASASERYDVVLLTRGGGSLEDLMAFNDEAVARAIHASAVPVVSAVGHEVDFSIADFVADLRAPTPSAAAELLVPDRADLLQSLHRQRERLQLLFARHLQTATQQLDQLMTRMQAQRPQARLEQGQERLRAVRARLTQRMQRSLHDAEQQVEHAALRLRTQHPRRQIPLLEQRLHEQHRRLQAGMLHRLERTQRDCASMRRALHAVSPLATLDRGYAIVFDEHGKTVRSVQSVAPDATLEVRLRDGILPVKHIPK
ncbi:MULTISPECIES: exodeoxyribonuclease VII large subunit [Oleiagrimonas]|uniref:Exodeoxyribonuclease 7 large subunit n=1 Tax=Oleiagrimonas citrea TaxID=1665687 RepID=A0A846ZLJ3_9GAMM|nr:MULTISPECIES: exodeoxyribonuclease VII large subunit [Oleiagrimonas]NKZ39185.1 exodeoxyribonuclease VII large subunit [Oleiagrimonas citrea]RAP57785.1 exodeoxyribonuclease VII large subunit [Oleiagrimonas sp. MCCC 1A03011]